jgi:hypothetical protein
VQVGGNPVGPTAHDTALNAYKREKRVRQDQLYSSELLT